MIIFIRIIFWLLTLVFMFKLPHEITMFVYRYFSMPMPKEIFGWLLIAVFGFIAYKILTILYDWIYKKYKINL